MSLLVPSSLIVIGLPYLYRHIAAQRPHFSAEPRLSPNIQVNGLRCWVSKVDHITGMEIIDILQPQFCAAKLRRYLQLGIPENIKDLL